MPKVVIYSTAICPYCVRAKRLLDRKGVRYQEIRVDLEPLKLTEMVQRSQRRTVPQIFIDSYHVGGYDDMVSLDMDERLNPLLGLGN
jgi:glutaredoxin 3